jgi:uncharacterized repeat protein (TIGR04076 family)
MSIKKYEKALTDETLQTPPASLRKGVKTSVKSPQNGFDVIVTAERVEGSCPLCITDGDEKYFTMSQAEDNENVCPFANYEMYQYVNAMSQGISAVDLGIANEGEDGFVTCGAWGCPTVESQIVFRLHPIPVNYHSLDVGYRAMSSGGHHSTPEPFMDAYSNDEVRQQREDLIEEWDKAGRPLFWDKWGTESLFKQKYTELRKQGLTLLEISQEIYDLDPLGENQE